MRLLKNTARYSSRSKAGRAVWMAFGSDLVNLAFRQLPSIGSMLYDFLDVRETTKSDPILLQNMAGQD